MERYDLMGTPTASSEEAGVLRIASEVDEKNCGCVDAAITPSNLYSLLDCRKANTAYAAGVIVTCPYHKEFLLKCTTGGTTSANSLDTTVVTKGNVITDGGVKWTVIASKIIDLAISGKTITVTFIDGTSKTLTTQDTAPFTARATSIGGASTTKPAVVVGSYRSGYNWYRVWSDGWVEQGGLCPTATSNSTTITLHKAMADRQYDIQITVRAVNNFGATYAAVLYASDRDSTNPQTTNFTLFLDNYSNMIRTWVVRGKGA